MTWRLARSLETLRRELDAAYPNRKKPDGTKGDAAHAARDSRHNENSAGVVCAMDVSDGNGLPIHGVTRSLIARYRAVWQAAKAEGRTATDADYRAAKLNPDLEYAISNREVASRQSGWVWRPYDGPNPHTAHVHFGVGRGPDGEPTQPYDDTDPWGIVPNAPASEEDDMLVILAPGAASLLHAGKLVHIETTAAIPKGVPQWDLNKEPATWENVRKAFGNPIS